VDIQQPIWIDPIDGFWLVVFRHPSEKYEGQLGLFFPIYGQIIQMFQTTNEVYIM